MWQWWKTKKITIIFAMFDWYTCFHLFFRFSSSSFSFQYFLLFFRSSRSYVLLLLLPTPSTFVICPSIASRRRQFLLRIWPILMTLLRRILFRSFRFPPIRSRTCSLVTFSYHFIFFILFQHYISNIFKYFGFFSVPGLWVI